MRIYTEIKYGIATKTVIACISILCAASIVLTAFADESVTRNKTSVDSSVLYSDEISTNRYTSFVENKEAICKMSNDGFEKKLENSVLELWYKEESESIHIVDKRSGYIWGCLSNDNTQDLNKTWRAFADSLCTVTYFDENNTEKSISLSESGASSAFEWNKDNALCSVKIKKIGLSFDFKIILKNDCVSFEVMDDTIKESEKGLLKSISFVGFFGSSFEDEIPGYFLIPDGSGALIRFNKSKNYNSGYEKRFFGSDFGIDEPREQYNLDGNRTNDYATDVEQVMLPMYGIVHGEKQNAVLATVDNGAEYATLRIMPAGISSVPYNWGTVRFDYRQLYSFKVSDSNYVSLPQEEYNSVKASLTFQFISGDYADYSGIAAKYSEYLEKAGLLPDTGEGKKNIPVLLNIIGSEVKKGFLKNKLSVLTTAEQATDMIDSLIHMGVKNETVIYSGWISGGYSGYSYGDISFEKKVGTSSDFKDLKNYIESKNGRFVLGIDPITANKDQINVGNQAGLSRSKKQICTEIPNDEIMYNISYFIKPDIISEYLNLINNNLGEYDFYYENLGKLLYSDYTRNNKTTRAESRDIIIKSVSENKKGYYDNANLYMYPYIQAFVNIPMSNSQYMYETDSVPFLQLLLKGRIDYYAPYSNQGFYSDTAVLKMIEYGAYPSLICMHADNFDLFDTPLENYYSLNFNDWKEEIVNIYKSVNDALSAVEGSSMLDHNIIAPGVAKVRYDNGMNIYVNYNDYEFSWYGLSVEPRSYLVKEEKGNV